MRLVIYGCFPRVENTSPIVNTVMSTKYTGMIPWAYLKLYSPAVMRISPMRSLRTSRRPPRNVVMIGVATMTTSAFVLVMKPNISAPLEPYRASMFRGSR